MRKYRAEGRYADRESGYYQRTKSWPMQKARSQIFIEVRAGRLISPKKLHCADCGIRAQCYDHRDYTKPLDVQPVCRRCNKARGPGKNKREIENET